MKKLQDINPNTRVYWDSVYQGSENRLEYEKNTLGPTGNSTRFYRVIEEVKDLDKFLDIGCGIGTLTSLIQNSYPKAEVWGTDISAEAMRDNNHQDPRIKYLEQTVGAQTLLPVDYFDVVFSGEVLEHIDEPADLFKDAQRVLKSGGKFIVTTPLENHINSPEHVWSYTHEDIETLFKENGFGRVQFVYLPNGEHFYVIFAIGKKV